jgi:hypothetical protein
VVDGRAAVRACIVNFRTEAREVELLVDEAATVGHRLHTLQ